MILNRLAEGLVQMKRDDTLYLGIKTGVSADAFTASQFVFLRNQKGWIVEDGHIRQWNQIGYYEDDKNIYIFGPYVEGVTLAEILQYEPGSALPYLSRLCRALVALQENRRELPLMHTRAIIFLKNGGVLFLPQSCVRVINDYQSPADRMRLAEPFNHPQLKEEEAISFALATLCYLSFTHHLPWEAEDTQTLHSLMRSGVIADMHIHVPEIRPEVNQEIIGILSHPKHSMPVLHYWKKTFTRWLQEGVHRQLHQEEQQRITHRARLLFEQRKKSYKRRLLFRDNWGRIVGVLLIAIAVASIPIAILRYSLNPREIRGLPPNEVIRLFYGGFNDLNFSIMQESLADGYQFAEVDEVQKLYISSRLRMAFEFQFPYIDPLDWQATGGQPLANRQSLYGIDMLTMRSIEQSDLSARYMLTYRKWGPTTLYRNYTPNGPNNSVAFMRRDLIHLRKENNSWVIYHIERLADSHL